MEDNGMDHFEQRLARIEHKIDTLADAVVNMARIEERMVTLFSRMDAYDKRLNASGERTGILSDRVVELEKSTLTLNAIEKVFYIVVTAAVSSIFWYFQRGL